MVARAEAFERVFADTDANILQACRQAVEKGELTKSDYRRIRRAKWFRPRKWREVREQVADELMLSGMVLEDGNYGVDLDAILAFIRELIPLILQIIDLF